jgi:hypothetical protein
MLEIMGRARQEASETIRRWIDLEVADWRSEGGKGLKELAGFGISHIPLVGPILGQVWSKGAKAAKKKYLEHQIAQMLSRSEARTIAQLSLLEVSRCAETRAAYLWVMEYMERDQRRPAPWPADCQQAYEAALDHYVGERCIAELTETMRTLDVLIEDMRFYVDAYARYNQAQIVSLTTTISDKVAQGHPEGMCMGRQHCYWQQIYAPRTWPPADRL